MEVKIKKLRESAIIPTRGSEQAAGYDLYANINSNIVLYPRRTEKIDTGLAIEIPDGYFGAIFARSGLATNKGLRPANAVGVIDSDYRGECVVAIYNDSEEIQVIKPNDKIAQLVIIPYLAVEFGEVDVLSDTERGCGGFGSTGE